MAVSLKTSRLVMAVVLALGLQHAASLAVEPQRLPPLVELDAAVLTSSPMNENRSVAELTSQTAIPPAMTLSAEYPALAHEVEPGIMTCAYISVADSSVKPAGAFASSPTSVTASVAYSTPGVVAPASASTMPPRSVGVAAESPSYSTFAGCCACCGGNPCGSNCCGDSCCSNNCCECCCQCGPPGQFWLRDEYVGWWAQGGQVPALVNTSNTGTLPATVTLYGNATYNNDYRSGNWVQGGMWFDCCHEHGIQADYFFVGREASPFFASSDGQPILTRPFIDATTGLPAEELVAVPGIVVGRISIDNHNSLDGAGVSMRCNLCCCDHDCCPKCGCKDWCEANCCRVDFVYGFRYYNFSDNLGIREQLTSIDPLSPIAVGTMFDIRDSFTTQNNFYGGEIGLIGQRYYERWLLEGTAKVALGDMNSIVSINGSTVVSFPGQPTVINQGGLLALSSNIGRHEHDAFVAIPQFSLRVGYRATERLTFLAGYTFMYFSQIARAGDQIDTTINPNLIPPVTPPVVGPLRPAFNFHPSDLVLQGITLGAEYSF